jgi:hypothetical protein
LADAVERLMAGTTRATPRASGVRAVDHAQIERDVGERAAEVERAAHGRILTAIDVDAPSVVIDGRVHTRVHHVEGRYYTLAGDVVVLRSLYWAARQGRWSTRSVCGPVAWTRLLPQTAAPLPHKHRAPSRVS